MNYDKLYAAISNYGYESGRANEYDNQRGVDAAFSTLIEVVEELVQEAKNEKKEERL